MDKIKLFVDGHVFDGVAQGTVSFIAGLYSELIKYDRIELYVGSNNKAEVEKQLKSSNFTHINYKTNSKIKRLLFTIPNAIKKYKIDFAHFQYISPIQKYCNYIVTIHDLLFLEYPNNFPLIYRIKNKFLFYISGKRADILTTVSNYSRNSINKYFRIPKDKIFLTPNGVTICETKQHINYELAEKKYLLFVSRIEPRKNQALLIQIWKELGLSRDQIELVIIGSMGVIDTNFKDQIASMSLEEKQCFHWFEGVSSEELVWLYRNCALFIFPSSAEGFGIPPLEAAFLGAKVICSRNTAMNDFTFFKEYLFTPENKEEFKSKILFALSNDFPHDFVKTEIKKKYDWGKIAQNFFNTILESMNAKN